ncbi:MAG TPA: P-loop NTPase fold protein [Thermoanaerobaculia bacterium]|nr:P-loop NTPase fold protein [Thermoanaerobaculia bacterium]
MVKLLATCERPFVVSIEGEWGRGKSTLLGMVVDALRHPLESDDAPWEVVEYHPWRYNLIDFDDAWESMVEVITQGLGGPLESDGRLETVLRLVGESRAIRLAWRTGTLIASNLLPLAKAPLEAIGQMAEGVGKLLEKSERLGPRYLIFEDVRRTLEEISRDRRVLLVIDDVDRCEPQVVAHVLRCLPTLFAPRGGPKFAILIAMDRKAATVALERSLGWEPAYSQGFLDKIIQVHVTLPVLQIGDGDRKLAEQRLREALTQGGNRRSRSEIRGEMTAKFTFPEDRLATIARFMHHNPRELERFCLLFDLKWDSRFEPNREAVAAKVGASKAAFAFQEWLDKFRDRLIWEAIVELRWPLYDAKPGDLAANKRAIENAIQGKPALAPGLPCDKYLEDADFLEIHRIYFETAWPNA